MEFGEELIVALPDKGDLELIFIRLYPYFKIVKRMIPIEYFSGYYKLLKKDIHKKGIKFTLDSTCLKVVDYLDFVKSLFPKMDVQDFQNSRKRKGTPDFRISNEKGRFYLEFKGCGDSVLPSQLTWIGENSDKESWFLILGRIDVDSRYYMEINSPEQIEESSSNL